MRRSLLPLKTPQKKPPNKKTQNQIRMISPHKRRFLNQNEVSFLTKSSSPLIKRINPKSRPKPSKLNQKNKKLV
jgi:hypothetical protein